MWGHESEKSERLAHQINKLLGEVSARRKLLRFLYICAAINALIWVPIPLAPFDVRDAFNTVWELNDKISKIVLAVPLALGMAVTYSLLRLKFPDIEDQNLEAEVMGSFAYQANSTRRWMVWVFSTVGGILNVVMMILITVALTSD